MNKYFDNASTSYPKPPQVAEAVAGYINGCGGTYGRAAYGRVYDATSMVERCRDGVAAFLGVANAGNIAFTPNATTAINTIIRGMNLRGGTVLVSPMEHNAVMRPLYHLEQRGDIKIAYLPSHSDGRVDTEALSSVATEDVRLVCCVHQSNVNGVIQPVAELCRWAGKIPVLVDATQSAGYIPVEGDLWGAAAIAFTGHKGLYGPTGTGGFYVRDYSMAEPLVRGGTGSNSESFEMPNDMPDLFEAGTPNMVGLAGLNAALVNHPQWNVTDHQWIAFIEKLRAITGIKVYCANNMQFQGRVVSFTHDKHLPSEIAFNLFSSFGIEVRQGLHCAPLAHRTLGSFPSGTVRIAISAYHTADDLNALLKAIELLVGDNQGIGQ